MLKEGYSVSKLKFQGIKDTQKNIISNEFKKRANRNKPKENNNKVFGKTFRSFPKIKYEPNNKDHYNTTLINYFEKKKHLTFYKGSNISVSSIILDTNTTLNNNPAKNTSISARKITMKRNKSQIDIYENYLNNNIKNHKDSNKKKKKNEEIKSTINSYLDISKLKYKIDITAIRNKFSLLFNKEFDLFDKFIPSLYTLRFEKEKKEVLSNLHNNSLSCIKYLTSTFLDQEIEHFKINEMNLTNILSNLLNLFTYNNKINQYLINNTKKYMVETNREKQNKKELFEVKDNTQIENLMKKLEKKNETIKKLKKAKFEDYNDHMINMYKLSDEQKDLIRLLLLNKNYYNKYQDSQKEIKEKNDLIMQKNIDYKSLEKKILFEKIQLEDGLIELEDMINPIKEENLKMKEKINDLENKESMSNEILKNKNEIINSLKENLMMKNEELLKCLYDLNKLKYQHDKLTYNYIEIKSRYKYFTDKEKKIINGDCNDEI